MAKQKTNTSPTTKAVTLEWVPFGDLVFLENNPRTRTEEGKRKMAADIEADPSFYENRPTLVNLVNGRYQVYAGDLRAHAAHEVLGWSLIPCNVEADVPPELMRSRAILDNTHREEWDADKLAQWDYEPEELAEMGVWLADGEEEGEGGVPNNALNSEAQEEQDQKEAIALTKLSDRFIAPPFSVLDTRQGYWLERKRYWKATIGDEGESRQQTLSKTEGSILNNINSGVSILDPVLAECMVLWFGIDGGQALDPFAGDTVFGYVAASKGMGFTGIELRKEQADLNNKRVEGMAARYICDDGQNVAAHIEAHSQDLLFSCPPYFDLEVYSDNPLDASNQKEYSDFLAILDTAFTAAISRLKKNRFAVVVVGDIRDKKGFYRQFPDAIKAIFHKNGMPLYNEIILVESLGTLPQRAARGMSNRKVGKCHQNILVFYNGKTDAINKHFKQIEFHYHEGTDVEL